MVRRNSPEDHYMTPDPGRVQAVFLAALEYDARIERAVFLDRECAADEELRRRVEALLFAHHQPDARLDRPFVVLGGDGAAIEVRPADDGDELKPFVDDSEQAR
jgi:hypothetical protein